MRRSFCLLVPALLTLASTNLAQEIMVDTRRDNVQTTVVAEPAVSTRLTPELWLYEQERIRMDDPAQAVRRKAEIRGIQRAERMAAMKWYGMNNSRPVYSNVTPALGGFGSPSWGSNTYDANRWRPNGPAFMIR
jgi:hypothetical protein